MHMTHYGIAQWVDFARNVVSREDESVMRVHLETDCAECRELEKFCQELNTICRGKTVCVVPDEVIRQARGIFPAASPGRPKRAARVPVMLVFDSFLVPSPAGLRTTWQVGWQALYRAGSCSVDLRIEPDLTSSRAAIIGQISNHVAPELQMAGLPVCLKEGKLVIAESRSNQFGEFQMEYEQQGAVQLCIYLEDGNKCIQVPLKRLVSDRASAKTRLNLTPPSARNRGRSGDL